MGETFYTILDVSTDAGPAAIRRAYREQVKQCHPDVSDAPDANRRFKRLTTARDVLLDDDERAAYDRLGHESYVAQHVESSVWQAETAQADRSGQRVRRTHSQQSGSTGSHWQSSSGGNRRQPSASGASSGRASSTYATGQATGSGWTGRDATGSTWTTTDQQSDTSGSWSGFDGRYTDDGWQRAPDEYMRAETTDTLDSSPLQVIANGIRGVGPWLFIHLILFVSAAATSWFMLNRVSSEPVLAALTGLFSLLFLGLIVMISALHVVTELS